MTIAVDTGRKATKTTKKQQQRIHISLCFTVIKIDAIVVFGAKQNVKYHAKFIKTTVKLPASVQVWGVISNRGLSLQRNVNGNMDSANYQSNYSCFEMTCECNVFLQKGYIFMHDLSPCHNSKSTRIFLKCKGIPVLE